MKPINTVGQINKMATYIAVALVCIISGCGKKESSPPSPATPVADKPQTSSATPASQPAITAPTVQKPVKPSEIIELNSLIQRIPTNEFAMSPEGGWDKFTMPKIQKWIHANLYGKRERINLYMATCKVAQEDAATKPDEWTVSLTVAGIHKKSHGMENRILPIEKTDPRVQFIDSSEEINSQPTIGAKKDSAAFSFKCTEAEARKFDALNKSTAATVMIEGDIVGIRLFPRRNIRYDDLGRFFGYDVFVELENVKVSPSNDTEPFALYACEAYMEGGYWNNMPYVDSIEIKRLDGNGDYQLVFMKYLDDRGNGTNLVSFSITKDMPASQKITCSDPPSESEISQAKAAVGWPSGQSLPK